MSYREPDLQNKIEALENKILELERENERLKLTLELQPSLLTDTNYVKSVLLEAQKRNPEAFMSTKEKRLLRQRHRRLKTANAGKAPTINEYRQLMGFEPL
jgi:hypothetical protein